MSDHVLFFEKKTRRPACTLIQAAMGGDSHFLNQHINSEWWTTSPEDLVPFTVKDAEVPKLRETLETLHKAGWPDLEKLK